MLPAALVAALASLHAPRAQELTIQNLAPLPRQEWCVVSVPFARGAVRETPDLHVPEHATVWQPFGARWPDGSLRYALCMFRARLPALGEEHFTLEKGPGPELKDAGDFGLPQFELEFQLRRGEELITARPQFRSELESSAARKVVLLSCRIGDSGLVGEVLITGYRGQPHAYADVGVFFSDPSTPDLQREVQELALETRGMALFLRHPGLLAIGHHQTETGNRVVLLRNKVLGDAMGIRRTGALLPPLTGDRTVDDTIRAAGVCPPLGGTSAWVKSGAFGAFGYVPPPPPWLQGNRLRAAMANRHNAFVKRSRGAGDPFWNGPHGLAKNPSQTGDQNDFGVVKLQGVAYSGIPSFLLEVEPSVLQEACRPVHYFEVDGSPIRAAAHPDWVVWSGRTHWHCSVSRDRLGKPCPAPKFATSGWHGKDRQHWSTNYTGAFYLLTGAPWALREMQNEVQLYLSAQTIRPGLSTSSAGAPRGVGRTLLAASWLYLATGDQDLLQRMNERLEKIHLPCWVGRGFSDDKVRAYGVANPDGRMLQGKQRYWSPWQETLTAIGFAAAYQITGNAVAREMAEGMALNTLRHGWKVDERELVIATAIRWSEDGSPPTAEELATGDRAIVVWSYGTAFSEWSIGAVELGRVFAEERGDEVLAEKARGMLKRLRAGQRQPRDGWFDRLGEWDGVRWREWEK